MKVNLFFNLQNKKKAYYYLQTVILIYKRITFRKNTGVLIHKKGNEKRPFPWNLKLLNLSL